MIPEVLSEVQLSDIPFGDARLIADKCGLEIAVSLILHCSGINLYIAKKSFHPFIVRYVHENKNRFSPKELASRLDASETYIRGILKQKH